ncbi:LapA family protein [Nitrosomonas nitrosa]|uniref:LapA family protein n=1 Tax=Nitrosomonas nitrosa TaxID=52442 RepID=UPI0023F8C419|nr:lipopolysaccharide assembly protein LapA domain-containing protein [Nitrosomonas nitrosa]MCO6433142.1 DUF1049 domain-containing protein [Nitrosomonas nitrosa]
MRISIWILRIVIFLLLVSFAAKNTEIVSVNYYLGFEWQVPMIIVLLACFVLGTAFGFLACYIKKVKKQS